MAPTIWLNIRLHQIFCTHFLSDFKLHREDRKFQTFSSSSRSTLGESKVPLLGNVTRSCDMFYKADRALLRLGRWQRDEALGRRFPQ